MSKRESVETQRASLAVTVRNVEGGSSLGPVGARVQQGPAWNEGVSDPSYGSLTSDLHRTGSSNPWPVESATTRREETASAQRRLHERLVHSVDGSASLTIAQQRH